MTVIRMALSLVQLYCDSTVIASTIRTTILVRTFLMSKYIHTLHNYYQYCVHMYNSHLIPVSDQKTTDICTKFFVLFVWWSKCLGFFLAD